MHMQMHTYRCSFYLKLEDLLLSVYVELKLKRLSVTGRSEANLRHLRTYKGPWQ